MSGDLKDAVYELFVAFGAQRQGEQAKLYVEELQRGNVCGECAVQAVRVLMRSARRLPPLMQVLTEAIELMATDEHGMHIVRPLSPARETFWRTEAVEVIMPRADNDPDLAALVAAQMWWSGVEPDRYVILEEIRDYPVWIDAARSLVEGKDLPAIVTAAFQRAAWAHDHHPSEIPPPGLVDLEPALSQGSLEASQ